MGDPRKQRRQYQRPNRPWQKERLEEEAQYIKEYGLKNKKEIWKARSLLKHFGDIAKKLVRLSGEQAEKEELELIKRLRQMGLLDENSSMSDVLTLGVKDLFERRLQTLVYRKNLARSMKQARQFITHGHISIGNTKVTVPSYSVKVDEENDITFVYNSALSDKEHPERFIPQETAAEETKAEKEEVVENGS